MVRPDQGPDPGQGNSSPVFFGTTRITLKMGQRLKATTDEIGGCIFAETQTASGEEVLVPLGENEWKLA